MSKEWYFAANGRQTGPVSEERFRQMVAEGAIGPGDLVWNESFTEWVQVRNVPDFAQAVAATPQAFASIPESGSEPQHRPVLPLGYVMPNREDQVTQVCVDLLSRTRPWVMVIAIVLFICIGLMVIGAIAILAVAAATKGAMALLSLVYLVMAGVYFFPALYLTRYSRRISDVRRMGRAVDLEAALDAQRAFWKFSAILMLIVIGLYILIIPIAMIMK